MPASARNPRHGWRLLWLICLCHALVPGLAQASLTGVNADTIGEPIAQFRFSGNARTQESYMLQESQLHVGQIITIPALENALQQLRDTDLFKEIQFQTERLENGEVTLHIIVEERYYWLLLPRSSRNNDGDISAGFRLRMYNLNGAGQTLDLLAEHEQAASGNDSNELNFKFSLPNHRRYYDLSWQLSRVITNTEVEGFDNVETRDFFAFAVARDWHLSAFSIPVTVSTAIALEKRALDEPYPESIGTAETGSYNRLQLSLILDDVHRERYRRFGDYYAVSIGQGFDWLGSDYDSTITTFEMKGFNRLNLYDNFDYRFVVEFSNNSPYDYLNYGIGGSSTLRGLEDVTSRGDARWFSNLEYVFAYRGHPQLRHTLFLDVGNVYDHLEDIDVSDVYYTVGTGFRWKIESFVKTDLFVDYGYDVDAGSGKFYGGTSLNF